MTIVVDVPCHHLGFEKVFCTAGPQKKLSGRYVILYVYLNIFIYLYRRSQGRIKVGRNDLFKNTCWSWYADDCTRESSPLKKWENIFREFCPRKRKHDKTSSDTIKYDVFFFWGGVFCNAHFRCTFVIAAACVGFYLYTFYMNINALLPNNHFLIVLGQLWFIAIKRKITQACQWNAIFNETSCCLNWKKRVLPEWRNFFLVLANNLGEVWYTPSN